MHRFCGQGNGWIDQKRDQSAKDIHPCGNQQRCAPGAPPLNGIAHRNRGDGAANIQLSGGGIADSRAMSRQMAQTALMHKSAIPAASAISNAAARELEVTAAIASIKPLPTRAVETTPQRPTFNP